MMKQTCEILLGRLMLTRILPVLVVAFSGMLVVAMMLQIHSHNMVYDSDTATRNGTSLPVKAYQVGKGIVSESIAAECTAHPNPLITVNSPIEAAYIKETLVKVGQQVTVGQLMIKLDDKRERAAYDTVVKEIEALQNTVNELQDLVSFYSENRSKGLSLEIDLRRARLDFVTQNGALATRKAELFLRREILNQTEVRATAKGVILAVMEPGVSANRNAILVRYAVVDPIGVRCSVADVSIPSIHENMEIEIGFNGLQSKRFVGTIHAVVPEVDPTTRTFDVQIALSNADRAIVPGQTGIGRIFNSVDSLRVPSIAIINPQARVPHVFVVGEDQRARLVAIDIGARAGGFVQIEAGLKGNDSVVVAGQAALNDGDLVRIL